MMRIDTEYDEEITSPSIESGGEEERDPHERGASRIRGVQSSEVDRELLLALRETPLTKPLGQGGYRMVFDLGNNPQVEDILEDTMGGHFPESKNEAEGWVIKVDIRESRELIAAAERIKESAPGTYFSASEAAAINFDEITDDHRAIEIHRREGYHEFADTFESDSTRVLKEVWQAQMVYIPEKYYLQLKGATQAEIDNASDKLVYAPVWCSFQPKMKEAENEADIGSASWEHSVVEASKTNPADPNSFNEEIFKRKMRVYNALNDAFIFEDEAKLAQMTPEVMRQALATLGPQGERLIKLFDYVEKSDKEGGDAREVLTDFVRSAIEYSQGEIPGEEGKKNDRMLDIYGKGNVRLVETPDGTVCEMIDAYLPSYERPFEMAGTLLSPGQPVAVGAEYIVQTLSYIRTINVMAHYLGIEERIHLYQAETDPLLIEYELGMTQEQVNVKYAALRNGKAMMFETLMLLTGTKIPGRIDNARIKRFWEERVGTRDDENAPAVAVA